MIFLSFLLGMVFGALLLAAFGDSIGEAIDELFEVFDR